ncbi:uncharacterized protein LOC132280174 isoform X2 [Cornus florida]|nr:uncharacterized protein LOC132280174 isoform X2 [Cornus florida]
MSDIFCNDNRPAFLSFMKKLFRKKIPKREKVGKEELDGYQAKYCPPDILYSICKYGAIDCAIAFFEGKTGFIANLNVPFFEGIYPLHLAANCLSYEMVALLLCHGARTDVRTIEGWSRGDLLPLNVSLETVSYHDYFINWTPKQSIFKLIIVLCLPQMRVPLEINRLLASRTKEVDKIFSHYAIQGELIEMATLLMVAREKIMPLSMFESKDGPNLDGSMSICESIIEENVSLTDDKVKLIGSHKNGKLVEESVGLTSQRASGLVVSDPYFPKKGQGIKPPWRRVCLSNNYENRESVVVELTEAESKLLRIHKIGKLVRSLKDSKAAMTQGLLLLKVFEKAGAAVEKYRQSVQSETPKEKVVNDIKALLERAGFILKDTEVDLSDIDCESESIKVAAKGLESRKRFGSHLKDIWMPSPSGSFSKNKSSSPYRMGRWWSVLSFLQYGNHVFRPSFHITFPPMDKKKAPSFSIDESRRPLTMRISAPYLLSRNRFASFAFAIKKGITRI